MHLVGARFDSADAADAALAELRDRLDLELGRAAVRPLGSTDYASPSEGHLLAGQFEDHLVAHAIEIVRRHGGVIVDHRPGTDGPRLEPRPGGVRQPWRPPRATGPRRPRLRSSPKVRPRPCRSRGVSR
jgi:hypothetical protein